MTALDSAHGANESSAWMERRRSDDFAALALSQRQPTQLGLLDIQYRAHRVRWLRQAIEKDLTRFIPLLAHETSLHMSQAMLARELDPVLDADVIYSPVGIGDHPDHRDIGKFAIGLAANGHQVRLYADTPYYLRYGLPSWIGDDANPLADALVQQGLDELPLAAHSLMRHVVQLEPQELDRKRTALERYTTEIDALKIDFRDVFIHTDMLRYEVYWAIECRTPPAAEQLIP